MLGPVAAARLLAAEADAARALPVQPHQAARQRGLARAVPAHERRHRPGVQPQARPAQHGRVAAVARLEAGRVERGGLVGGARARRGGAVAAARRRHARQVPGAQAQPRALVLADPREGGGVRVAHDAPAPHHHHPVGDAREPPQPVLGHEHGLARGLEPRDRLGQLEHGAHVERRRGLVQHEDVGAHRAHRGDGHHLALAARERADVAVAQVLDAQQGEGAVHAPVHLGAREPEVLAAERHLRGGVQVEELAAGVLEHRAHAPAQRVHLPRPRVLAGDAHRPRELPVVGDGDQPVRQARERGLAAAGAAGEHHALPCGHAQGHVGEGGLAGAGVGEARPVERKRRVGLRAHAITPSLMSATHATTAPNRAANRASAGPKRSS